MSLGTNLLLPTLANGACAGLLEETTETEFLGLEDYSASELFEWPARALQETRHLAQGVQDSVDAFVLGDPPVRKRTIYGFSHLNTAAVQQRCARMMSRARLLGARSVGLEISEKIKTQPEDQGLFPFLHHRALNMGMRVVFLEEERAKLSRTAISYFTCYVDFRGQFNFELLECDLKIFEEEVRSLTARLSTGNFAYSAPSVYEDIQRALRAAKDNLELVQEIERLARQHVPLGFQHLSDLWFDLMVHQVDAQLVDAIEKQKPDLIFVGGAHLAGIKGRLQLPYHFALTEHSVEDVLRKDYPGILEQPHAKAAFEAFTQKYSCIGTETIAKLLKDFLQNKFPEQIDTPEKMALFIEAACIQEPDFLLLFVRCMEVESERTFFNLGFGHGYRVLGMHKQEINERILAVLRVGLAAVV